MIKKVKKMSERINKKILDFIKDSKMKQKQINLSKNLKKEVDIGANGTQKYVIKKGINKGKIL
tara:strand:- start:227 stop:415 length:189 start_codon:yes stop_codon:yes gene_type:complete